MMGRQATLFEDYSTVPTWLRREELLHHAFSYAGREWRVFPIHPPVSRNSIRVCGCGNRDCKPGKHPCVSKFLQRATKNDSQILEWWDTWREANIGVLTGRASGIVVLDVDPRNGGEESLARLTAEKGVLPLTVTALTGGGGAHYYFRHPGGIIKSGDLGPEYPGLDVQAENVCVVAPPSLHATGERYRWVEGFEPQRTDLARLPIWLIREINSKSRKRPRNKSKAGELVKGESVITKGRRNSYLFSFAGAVSPYCSTQTELENYVSIHNRTHCEPPLLKPEIATISSSAYKPENGLLQDLLFNVWRPNALDKNEKAVLWILISYCDWKTWQCWPSKKTIAKSAGFSSNSIRTVDRVLKSLSSKGLISWRRIHFQSNHYTIHVDNILSLTTEENSSIPPLLDTGSERPIEEADPCPPDT
jgi:hypothetical protein